MAVDVVRYLEDQGLDIKYTGENVGSNDVAIQCPWCDDPSYHLTIHRSRGTLNCWRCDFSEYILKHPKGWRPSFKALIKEIEGISWVEVNRRWEEIGGDGAESAPKDIGGRSVVCNLPEEAREFDNPGAYKGARDYAYSYLRGRGFTRYHIDKYRLYFCPEGEYKNRIIIPIYRGGKVVNWLGRRYNKNIKWRYRNCNVKFCVIRLNELLYGEEEWNGRVLRLVEGALDKMRMEDSAVGLNRSKVSITQKQILRRIGARADYTSIILDPEAYSAAYEIAEELSPFLPRIKVVRLPAGTDPASLTAEQVIRAENDTSYAIF